MTGKAVVCTMLAAVAALAWQGLTSVPAGTDEEGGLLTARERLRGAIDRPTAELKLCTAGKLAILACYITTGS